MCLYSDDCREILAGSSDHLLHLCRWAGEYWLKAPCTTLFYVYQCKILKIDYNLFVDYMFCVANVSVNFRKSNYILYFARALNCCFQLQETLQNVQLVQRIRYFYLPTLPGQQNLEIYSSILYLHCLIKLKNCSGYVSQHWRVFFVFLLHMQTFLKKYKNVNNCCLMFYGGKFSGVFLL